MAPTPPPSRDYWLERCNGFIRCWVCQRAGLRGRLAQFEVPWKDRKTSNINRHAELKSHLKACSAATAGQIKAPRGAPDESEFRRVWENTLRGQAGTPILNGIDTRKKDRLMQWCIAEAKRSKNREKLKNAVCVTLLQDERGNFLLIRFKSTDAFLNTWSGNIGFYECGGTSSDLAVATMATLEKFCTPNFGRPAMGSNSHSATETVCDMKLFQHIINVIKIYCADAASDEQVAGEILMEPGQDGQALLPSLGLLLRDKAHASRRIITRPYKADPYLEEVYDMMLLNYDSVAAMICNAKGTLGKWFAANCEKSTAGLVQPGRGTPSLGFKRHRHNSMQAPCVRMVVFFDALLATAQMISSNRRGEEAGRNAERWLLWLDEEKCLQFALLADAADQTMELLRFHDRENCDPSEIAHAVSLFAKSIETLFIDNMALRCGMTATMLVHLKTPHTIVLQGGKVVKTIGCAAGVPADIANRCLTRMRCWARLALSVVQAEWPGFEIVQATTIFNLNKSTSAQSSAQNFFNKAGCSKEDCIRRLSGFTGTDPELFASEYHELLPIAQHCMDSGNAKTSLDAWRNTIRRCQDKRERLGRWCYTVVAQGLQFWAASGISTSGLEQTFAQVERLYGARRHNMGPQSRNDLMELVESLPSGGEEREIMRMAQQIWQQNCGRARMAGQLRIHRLDKGKSQPELGKEAKATLKSYLGLRRASVAALSGTDGAAFDIEASFGNSPS